MTRDEAAVCFARLVAHWPRLGGADPLAASRAGDWITSLTRLTPDTGMAAVSEVIESHREIRLPVFADIQDAARRLAARPTQEHRAIEAPQPDDTTKQRVLGLIEEARQALTAAQRPTPRVEPVKVSRYDPDARPPVFWGERRMTPDERDAELAAFGDRKVRTKNPH